MEFNNYKSYYELTKGEFRRLKIPWEHSVEQYYSGMISRAVAASFTQTNQRVAISSASMTCIVNQSIGEWEWLKLDKPYYKIYPEMISVFSKCPLDIPSSLFKMPHGHNAFAISLPSPESGNSFVIDKNHYVKSIFIHKSNKKFTDYALSETKSSITVSLPNADKFTLWFDLNEHEEMDGMKMPIYTYKNIVLDDTQTIEYGINKLQADESYKVGVQISQEMIYSCIRLVLSICFLAESNDPIIQPDVLSKDRDKLRLADERILSDLHERAKRKGKFGWCVGGEMIDHTSNAIGVKSAGNLSFAHIRSGHWHTVRHGVGRMLHKVMWFRPLTVRSDLPMRKI